MRTFQKEIMNQKIKIGIAISGLLTIASLTAFGVDANMNGSSGAKAVGLSKNEEMVKIAVSPQNRTPQVGEVPLAGSLTPTATPAPQANSTVLPPAVWNGPTLGDLEKLRSENAMLAEQLKNAELKKKIGEQGGLANSTDANRPSGSLTAKASSGPRVVMIAGGEGNYRANLILPNGQTMTASVGTVVSGFGAVSAITPDAIMFGSGKSKRSLSLVTNGANADYVMGQ